MFPVGGLPTKFTPQFIKKSLRDLGLSTTIGTGEQSITAAEGEIRSVLMTLDDYRATGTSNGVIF